MQDSFAYADGWDDAAGRYRGLRGGQVVSITEEDLSGLLVRPEVARKQQAAETPPPAGALLALGGNGTSLGRRTGVQRPERARWPRMRVVEAEALPRAVTLDPTRVGRDAGRIADEVIAHLAGLVGSLVKVTLEVEAEVPSGVPDSVVRTVTENSRTLKFVSQGFETE